MLLGRQPHEYTITSGMAPESEIIKVTATWRSRIKAEIAHHRRGVGSAVLVTTELDGYRTGPRLWPRPRMVLPASLTVHL